MNHFNPRDLNDPSRETCRDEETAEIARNVRIVGHNPAFAGIAKMADQLSTAITAAGRVGALDVDETAHMKAWVHDFKMDLEHYRAKREAGE